MFSLSYSAAYDPFHAIFRFCSLLLKSPHYSQQFSVLQICDFYLCFPWLLGEISAPRSVPGFQRTRNRLVRLYGPNAYDVTPQASTLFERMEPMQLAAFSALISKGLVDAGAARSGIATLVSPMLSGNLKKQIERYIEANSELIEFLAVELPKVPLMGKEGLKHRTGLKEYRYDYV